MFFEFQWVTSQGPELNSTEKLVLILLSASTDPTTGQCTPSIEELARMASLKKRQTWVILASLEKRQYIQRWKRKIGSEFRSSHFKLLTENHVQVKAKTDEEIVESFRKSDGSTLWIRGVEVHPEIDETRKLSTVVSDSTPCTPVQYPPALQCSTPLHSSAVSNDVNDVNFEGTPYKSFKALKDLKDLKSKATRTSSDDECTNTTSSSPSKEQKRRASPAKKPDGLSEQIWNDWVTHRKTRRASVTQVVVNRAVAEAAKAKATLDDFFSVWVFHGWQGCTADWYKRVTQPRPETQREREARMAALPGGGREYLGRVK